jgi:hypothetical protein
LAYERLKVSFGSVFFVDERDILCQYGIPHLVQINLTTPSTDTFLLSNRLQSAINMSESSNLTNGIPIHTSSAFTTTPTITTTSPPPEPEEVGLFGPELVSPTIAATLPSSYTLRALRKSDYAIGFLDVLRVLTTVGDITETEWNERYDWMSNQGKGGYYLLVIEDGGRIVGTGALLVERKL